MFRLQPSTATVAVATSALLAGLLGPSVPLGAQTQEPGVFGEVIEVRVVNLEVVVTNKKGNRVTGLKPEDFRLTVDGKDVPVEYFTEIFGGQAVERPSDSQISSVPQLAPGEAVSTSYLVFIDDYFSRAQDRDAVLQSMISQLDHLSPQDRMAVVAYDGGSLDMLSTWSQSTDRLAEVLQRAQTRKAHGLQWDALLRTYQVSIDSSIDVDFRAGDVSGALETELTPTEQSAVNEVVHQVERVVLAASSALRSFANPPGRKVMLLVSGGWPWEPVQFVTQSRFRASAGELYSTGEELYGQLIETANRLSYTLFTVDAPGMRADSGVSSAFGADTALGRSYDVFNRQFELDSSLTALARHTGGRAFLNGEQKNALEQVALDTRSYYWLGFTPSWKGNDESHDIKIRMRRKDLEVRARQSFSDLSRKAEVTMMVESSLLFGNPPSSEPLLARVGRAKKAGMGRISLPLTVIIPMSALTFIPGPQGYVAQTELRVAVLDENGNMADVPVIELPMVLQEPPKEGMLQRYETSVRMRKRKHDVVVSLYDTASGKILSAQLEVDPG